jgi:hypothetical protein
VGWKLKLDISYISNNNRSLSLIVYYQTQAGCKPNPIKITKDIGISLVPLLPKSLPCSARFRGKIGICNVCFWGQPQFSVHPATHIELGRDVTCLNRILNWNLEGFPSQWTPSFTLREMMRTKGAMRELDHTQWEDIGLAAESPQLWLWQTQVLKSPKS